MVIRDRVVFEMAPRNGLSMLSESILRVSAAPVKHVVMSFSRISVEKVDGRVVLCTLSVRNAVFNGDLGPNLDPSCRSLYHNVSFTEPGITGSRPSMDTHSLGVDYHETEMTALYHPTTRLHSEQVLRWRRAKAGPGWRALALLASDINGGIITQGVGIRPELISLENFATGSGLECGFCNYMVLMFENNWETGRRSKSGGDSHYIALFKTLAASGRFACGAAGPHHIFVPQQNTSRTYLLGLATNLMLSKLPTLNRGLALSTNYS
ncbi:hypothetical protein B0H19DRAFT_1075879 [Mycena capillaripes]|nr:hypothetical protein B0H19DRAFT_1075879 [Mycena capillaripes]